MENSSMELISAMKHVASVMKLCASSMKLSLQVSYAVNMKRYRKKYTFCSGPAERQTFPRPACLGVSFAPSPQVGRDGNGIAGVAGNKKQDVVVLCPLWDPISQPCL